LESVDRRNPNPSESISRTPSPYTFSFLSTYACRMEKMSSCFLSPEAFSMLRSRAICVNSPIFLLFRSLRCIEFLPPIH